MSKNKLLRKNVVTDRSSMGVARFALWVPGDLLDTFLSGQCQGVLRKISLGKVLSKT